MFLRDRRSLHFLAVNIAGFGTDFPGIFYFDIRAAGVVSPYKMLSIKPHDNLTGGRGSPPLLLLK